MSAVFTFQEAQGFRKLVFDQDGEEPEEVNLTSSDCVYSLTKGYHIYNTKLQTDRRVLSL